MRPLSQPRYTSDRHAKQPLHRRWRSVSSLLVALGAAAIALVPATAAAASAAPTSNQLHAGVALEPGQSLFSARNAYRLSMLRDGNLVLYRANHVVWLSNTAGHLDATAELERRRRLRHHRQRPDTLGDAGLRKPRGGELPRCPEQWGFEITSGRGVPLWSLDHPPTLQFGDQGAGVLALQRRLTTLGYWLGTPNGQFGDSTQQAVWAFQKAAAQSRDGVVGTLTWQALDRGVVPVPRPAGGNLIEVDLNVDLLMIIHHGKLYATLNTSTGGGYTYTSDGVTSVAITPQGKFPIYAAINGVDVDSLGTLWRPRFFVGGYAIHGDGSVPPEPVSHGCVASATRRSTGSGAPTWRRSAARCGCTRFPRLLPSVSACRRSSTPSAASSTA